MTSKKRKERTSLSGSIIEEPMAAEDGREPNGS
jgi:hypothetical protein